MAGKRKAEGGASVRGTRAADASWGELLRARFGRDPKPGAGSTKVKRTWPQRIRRWIFRLAIFGLVVTLLGVAAFIYVYKKTDIPDPNADFLTQTTYVYYDDGKTELGKFATQDRDSIPLSEMPEVLQQAVVAAEDQSFYSNNGIDLKGIARAVLNNAKGGSTQGASTITQQYVKILYLTQEQSYKRKVKEAILSLKIQREQSKDEILQGYLNTIYFGRGAYGVQAASQAYFGIPASKLDLQQAAVLASVLNDPNDLDPKNGKKAKVALKGRYDYVLNSMADTGDITEAEAEAAKKRLPKFDPPDVESTYGGSKGHMLTLVKNQLLRLTDVNGEPFTEEMIQGGGLRITTTLDEQVMDDIEEGVEAVRPVFTGPKAKKFQRQLHVGAATVEPDTGKLLGFYAGQDYLESQLNWAVAGGQAGSTFKPFAVAAGLKEGYSLKDTFDGNSPYTALDGSEFENQGDEDYGSAVSLLSATENSVNTAFIDLTVGMDDGPEKIIDMAEAMGIPPLKAPRKHPYGIPTETGGLLPNTGVALGSQTVSPINMANGYATIANEGVAAEVFVIDKVTDADGNLLYKHKVVNDRAVSADIASDVSYALQEVVTAGTGSAAIMSDGRPTAGKTGTATKTGGAVSSSWFAGFTPQRATAVMYVRGKGNGQLDGWLPASSDGREGYFGGNYPAKTWNAIMTAEHEGLEVVDFPEPAFVDGEAPQDGHAPYTPAPPKPTRTKTPKPDETTTEPPTSEPTEEPTTDEPTTEPPTSEPTTTDPCGLLGCPPTSDPPTSSPTQDPEPDPENPPAQPRTTAAVRERDR